MTDLAQAKKEWGGTYANYVKGLAASFILTILSFSLVVYSLLPSPALMLTISGLALVQAALQLIYFLHVGHEKAPRWKLHFFYCLVGVLAIIAAGSIWIMNDLNDRVMGYMEMHHD